MNKTINSQTCYCKKHLLTISTTPFIALSYHPLLICKPGGEIWSCSPECASVTLWRETTYTVLHPDANLRGSQTTRVSCPSIGVLNQAAYLLVLALCWSLGWCNSVQCECLINVTENLNEAWVLVYYCQLTIMKRSTNKNILAS